MKNEVLGTSGASVNIRAPTWAWRAAWSLDEDLCEAFSDSIVSHIHISIYRHADVPSRIMKDGCTGECLQALSYTHFKCLQIPGAHLWWWSRKCTVWVNPIKTFICVKHTQKKYIQVSSSASKWGNIHEICQNCLASSKFGSESHYWAHICCFR